MGTSVHLSPPSPDHWHTSFFFLAGPGHLHEIAVSAFSRKSIGPCKYLFIPIASLNPPYYSERFSDFTLFLSASLSLRFMFSSSSTLHLPKFSADSISCWFAPISFHTFSTTLSHLIPARPFVTFSHTAPSAMAGSPLLFILQFQLSHVSACLEWVHSQFCSQYGTWYY